MKTKQTKPRAGNAKGKPACKRVRTMEEAIKAKEIVELPNGWRVTPESVSGLAFPTIDTGRPIPDSIFD